MHVNSRQFDLEGALARLTSMEAPAYGLISRLNWQLGFMSNFHSPGLRISARPTAALAVARNNIVVPPPVVVRSSARYASAGSVSPHAFDLTYKPRHNDMRFAQNALDHISMQRRVYGGAQGSHVSGMLYCPYHAFHRRRRG